GLAELFVQCGFSDGTFLDIHHQAAVGAQKADHEALRGLVPLAADHDAVAIAEWRGAGDDGINEGLRETAEAPEKFGDLFLLQSPLFLITDVLVLAAATFAEDAADRCHPGGRWFKN